MPQSSRHRSAVRRRRLTLLAAVLAIGAGVGACTTMSNGAKKGGGSSTTSSSADATSTSDKRPPKPSSYNVGVHTFYWVDHSRDTPDPATGSETAGRVLTTEVRYPTTHGSKGHETVNASPATPDGPFPVVVFAHGYDVDPSIYAPLLDAWVRSGFVVVSPIFPDENAQRVAELGGPNTTLGTEAENDEVNEPGDLSFVLAHFAAIDAAGSGASLAGIGDLSEVALAGQSDGANVVAALAFGPAYRSLWASTSPAPKAVLVLSGEALDDGPGGETNLPYSSSASSPDVLQVQSNADTCNSAQDAADLFRYFGDAPAHLFQLLDGASHLQPYTDAVSGPNPYAPVVAKATTAFLRFALGVHTSSLASVEAAATSSISKVFSSSAAIGPAIQNSPPQSTSGCALP